MLARNLSAFIRGLGRRVARLVAVGVGRWAVEPFVVVVALLQVLDDARAGR